MSPSLLAQGLPACPPGICQTWCTCSPIPTTTSTGFIVNPAVNPLVGTGSGTNIIQTFIVNFLAIGFGIGAIVFVFMLITGGIQYITSGSDKDAVQHASKRISHALIGITILFSIYAIIALVGSLFGINLLRVDFPTF